MAHDNTDTNERTTGQRLFTHLTVTFCVSVVLMLLTQMLWNDYLMAELGLPELDKLGALILLTIFWFVLSVGTIRQ